MSIPGLPSIKEFVEAMSVAWPVAFAICVASAAVLYANQIGFAYAKELSPGVLTTMFCLAIFSAAVVLTAALRAVLSAPLLVIDWWQEQGRRKARVEMLHGLPSDEHYLMSYMASYGKQAFEAPFGHEKLVGLVQKGLVRRADGQHLAQHWPYYIPDYIWSELQSHPEKFRLPKAPYHRTPLEWV